MCRTGSYAIRATSHGHSETAMMLWTSISGRRGASPAFWTHRLYFPATILASLVPACKVRANRLKHAASDDALHLLTVPLRPCSLSAATARLVLERTTRHVNKPALVGLAVLSM